MSDTVTIQNSLFEKVAERLAGRPVCVRFQPPVAAGVLGETYKTIDGRSIIDLDPAKHQGDNAKLLSTFLHEVAHVLADDAEPSNHVDQPPGSDTKHRENPTVNTPWYKNREKSADDQADVWFAWSERHMSSDNSQPKIVRQLQALEQYMPQEVEDFINQTVKECISKGFSDAHTRVYTTIAVNKQFGDGTKALGNSLRIIER